MLRRIWIPTLLLVMTGCDGPAAAPTPETPDDPDHAVAPPPPTSQPIERADPAPSALERATPWRPQTDRRVVRFAGLEGTKPVTWEDRPPQTPRLEAHFVVPGFDDHDQAHIDVVRYPSEMFDVDAQVERWTQRFRPDDEGVLAEAAVQRGEVAGFSFTHVELMGDYAAKTAVWYTTDQLLIGVIVETPEAAVVIRFVGDVATVDRHRPAFIAMIDGLQPVDD